MKLLISVLLSVAFIALSPHSQKHINKSSMIKPVEAIKASVRPAMQTNKVAQPSKIAPQAATGVVAPAPIAPVQQPVVKVAQGCSSYLNLFSQYDWSVSTALAICNAESRGNTSALSPTCDRGLMQINCIHADMVGGNLSALYDPATNISVAYRIYSGRGWNAWSTYLSGQYLSYI